MANLQALHQQLLAMLAELEALTAEPGLDEARLSLGRYRLSRVSGERRRLVDRLCAEMAARATPEQAAELQALRRSTVDTRIASTAHIGTWTPREIAADWQGYCRASALMRARMRSQIAAEKALLYAHVTAAAA